MNPTIPISNEIATSLDEQAAEMTGWSTPKYSPAQARKMADWDVADKLCTREEADARLRANGVEPIAPNAPPTLSDYRLTPFYDLTNSQDPKAQAVAALRATAAGAFLVAGQFDKTTGDALTHTIAAATRKTAGMNAKDRAAHTEREEAALRNTWGVDYERNRNAVRSYISSLGSAAGGMESAKDSALLQLQIFQHIQRAVANGRRQ